MAVGFVADHTVNVILRLLKATFEFLLWGEAGFAKSFSCPTQLLCCIVVGVVTKISVDK